MSQYVYTIMQKHTLYTMSFDLKNLSTLLLYFVHINTDTVMLRLELQVIKTQLLATNVFTYWSQTMLARNMCKCQ